MKRFIGLRNIVTSKNDWKYLLNYEIDGHDESKCLAIIAYYSRVETSYICYKTKHGFHFIGLTPMNAQKWGYHFETLQNIVPEYYSGQTIRLSLKEGEKQELIHYSFVYPAIWRLYMIFRKRFADLPEDPHTDFVFDYSCVFEKYWSEKI